VARIAVAGGDGSGQALSGGSLVMPCGGCRQAILEAAQRSGRDISVICASGDGDRVEVHSIAALLPSGFGPDALRHGA